MEWWAKLICPLHKVWSSLATRLGIRKSGILKLRNDVRTCEYEDVHKMWEMLNRNETENNLKETKKKRPCWNFLRCWTTPTPYLCRKF